MNVKKIKLKKKKKEKEKNLPEPLKSFPVLVFALRNMINSQVVGNSVDHLGAKGTWPHRETVLVPSGASTATHDHTQHLYQKS